jgi:hypothetical protein
VTTAADSGPGSLRQAIFDADAGGGGSIVFQFPGGGAQTISPTSFLPPVVSGVAIDGTTEGGFSGAPLIGLDGASGPAAASGLTLLGGDAVFGLSITRFAYGVVVFGSGSTLQGDYLGTDAACDAVLGNYLAVF